MSYGFVGGLLLAAGVVSACASDYASTDGDGVDDNGVDGELGSLEQAFSSGATGVAGSENTGVPFVSAVKYNIDSTNCSGVKIPPLSGSTRVRILTAAHCIVESGSSRQVRITNATNGSLPTGTLTVPAGRTFVHPSFQLGNVGGGKVSENVYDVAFFELDGGPTFSATPLGINFINNNGVQLLGIGYGNAGVGCGSVGGTKLKANLLSTSVSGDDRDAHFIFHSGDPTSCSGDSGGPVLLGTGANAKVVGVISGLSLAGTPPLTSVSRIQGAFEWLNDPVDSTQGANPPRLLVNNSSLYLMNGALNSAMVPKPLLGCAAMNGTGSASGTDVRLHTCDVLDGTTQGQSPGWALVTGAAAGSFKILNRRNGLCLGASATPVAGTNVAAFTCATSGAALDRQTWKFTPVTGFASTTAYQLTTIANAAFCLSGGTGAENADVVLQACSTSANNQKWYPTR